MSSTDQHPEQSEVNQILKMMREQDTQAQRRWRLGVAIQLIAVTLAATIAIGLQGDALRVQDVVNWWYWSFGAGFILVVGSMLAVCFVVRALSQTSERGNRVKHEKQKCEKPEDVSTLDEKVLLREIRDEIRASREAQWLPVGVTVGVAFFIGGIAVFARYYSMWFVAVIMLLGGAFLVCLVVCLSGTVRNHLCPDRCHDDVGKVAGADEKDGDVATGNHVS